jgi:hypothetical protein
VVRLCSSCSDYGEVWAQVAMALRGIDKLGERVVVSEMNEMRSARPETRPARN